VEIFMILLIGIYLNMFIFFSILKWEKNNIDYDFEIMGEITEEDYWEYMNKLKEQIIFLFIPFIMVPIIFIIWIYFLKYKKYVHY